MSTQNEKIKENLKFILSHFSDQIFNFPRAIKTFKTKNQVFVNNEEDILYHFLEADLIDCKINAYPLIENDLKKILHPNFIFIDLDLSLCKVCKFPQRKLDYLLQNTLKEIKIQINGHPTVLWNGHGYHIYQPVKINDLTQKAIEKREMEHFVFPSKGSFPLYNDTISKFLKHSARYLTINQKDCDYNDLSIGSCFTLIPETINSKSGSKIEIIQKWDGNKANADIILKEII